MNSDIKIIKTILLIISCIVFFVIGLFISFIILVDKVYASSPTFTQNDFTMYVKNNLSNQWSSFNYNYFMNNYIGDYNGVTGNGYINDYRLITNNKIDADTYTLYLKIRWEYNSTYLANNLGINNFVGLYGSSADNITNTLTKLDGTTLQTINYGTGGEWDAFQEYLLTFKFRFNTSLYFAISIQNFAEKTGLYIESIELYKDSEVEDEDALLNDIINNSNYNREAIIANNNSNTQSIISNNNTNTNTITSNQNQNTQTIINNQNLNAEATQEAIDEGFNECGYNLIQKNMVSIGGIASATGQDANTTHRLRIDYIEVDNTKTYKMVTNLPYAIYYLFYYDSNKDFISSTWLRNGSDNYTINLPTNTKYIRIALAKFDNGVVDNNYVFNNEDIFNLRLNLWSDTICRNRIDSVTSSVDNVNNSVDNVNNSINNLNNNLTNSSVSVGSNDINSMNSNIATNSVISDLLLLPVTLFQSILNSVNGTCSSFNLGSLFGTNLVMPCINIQNKIGSTLYSVIDILISGFFILSIRKKFVDIFNNITSLKDGGNELE